MDIMLIDFDTNFSAHIKKWLDENSDTFKDLSEVEIKMPEIYDKWLNTPQEFLSGSKPNEYFLDFEAGDLVALMIRYEAKHIGCPDPLMDAISIKKDDALPYLSDIVFGKSQLPKGADSSALKITSLNLVNEIDPSKYIKDYIKCIASTDIDEGVAECMADAVKVFAKAHKAELIDAVENTDSALSKQILLDILCNLEPEQRVYEELISMLKMSSDKALYASYLGKYGYKEAVKVLLPALDWLNINYLDYIEIRNAIEQLGEEVTHARNFEGDKYYESMKGIYDE